MKFDHLIGQVFQENELHQKLVFDIESDFDHYLKLFAYIYFDRLPDGHLKVTQIDYFTDRELHYQQGLRTIEKREWFEINQLGDQYALVLVRLDRTGTLSTIYRTHTRTEEWKMGYEEEEPPLKPMTPEERRLGMLQLAGIMADHVPTPSSRNKKTA